MHIEFGVPKKDEVPRALLFGYSEFFKVISLCGFLLASH